MPANRSATLRYRPLIMALVMGFSIIAVTALTMVLLYRTELEQQQARLIEVVKSQALLIEAVAHFDAVESVDAHPDGALAATLGQIRDAHRAFKGFGATGEFTLAEREGDQIVFLLSHRHLDLDTPVPVPWNSKLAEPMRRALSGQSGAMVGLDYRGEKVLAAYEPLSDIGWGIVAKIDFREIQKPFFAAIPYAMYAAFLLVLLGTVLFFKLTTPLVMDLEHSENKLRSIIETAVDSIIGIDCSGKVQIFNKAAERMFGYSAAEVIGKNVNMLMPEPYHSRHDSYIRDYLATGIKKVIGNSREVQGLRKDGSIFPARLSVSEVQLRTTGERMFTGIIADTTQERIMEQEMRQHAAVFHHSKEAIMIMDANHSIQQVNQAFSKITGYSPEEVIGAAPTFLFPEKPDSAQLQKEQAALDRNEQWEGDIWLRHKNGELFRVWVTSTAVRDTESQVHRYLRMFTDVSNGKPELSP